MKKEMDVFPFVLLFYLMKLACTGSHSLWYFITLTVGPSPFPEMVIVGMVDDVPVEYYDSIDRTMTSRWHLRKEEGDVAYAAMKRMAIANAAHSLNNKLQHMIEHFNHSISLHTYQRIAGCELDDDGTERFQAKDSYNGKDVVFYDVESYTWSSLVPEMQRDYWMMESYKALFHQLYQPLCVHTLKSYLHQERSILKQRVRPRITVFRRRVGEADRVEVTCLATGFYPRHIELTMQRDNQPVPRQELIGGDILPNGDGTYQLRMSLRVSRKELEERHHYTCSVRHVSMDNKLDITWDSQPMPKVALISGVSLTVLSTVLVFMAAIFIWRRRKSDVPRCTRLDPQVGQMDCDTPDAAPTIVSSGTQTVIGGDPGAVCTIGIPTITTAVDLSLSVHSLLET
ncbi:hypothetical protein GJAV_G00165850 [Gymnothorax javanicus]|nr:hypothetical protein GJAV_G00165850 [Gymnothorax javanicus]